MYSNLKEFSLNNNLDFQINGKQLKNKQDSNNYEQQFLVSKNMLKSTKYYED